LTAELFDRVPLDRTTDAEQALLEAAADIPRDVCERLETAKQLSDADRETIIQIARKALARFQPKTESESKPEVQAEAKPELKSELRTKGKPQAKADPKPELEKKS